MYQLKSLKIVNIISYKNQEFIFRNGKAVMVIGDNKTDPSQRGNGAGKSGLIESISIAYSGSPIRDVSTKELIYRGEASGEIELVQYNTETGKEFKIWRKIYANTKSAEYKAWIGGVEQNKNYSDFNTFNDFVWRTLGISKADFFSFYLLTKSTDYKPFLTAGDAAKKSIIARFSGADKVDVVFPEIEADSKRLEGELATIERELVQNNTRKEVYAEQLASEEAAVSDERKIELIEAKEIELVSLLESESDFESKIKIAEAAVNSVEKEIANFQITSNEAIIPFQEALELANLEVELFEYTENFVASLEKIAQDKLKVTSLINEEKLKIPKIRESFAAEIQSITSEEHQINISLGLVKNKLGENEAFESEVSKQLHDAIECPNCHHFFSLRDEKFNYAEAKAKLPVILEEIEKAKAAVIALNDRINVDIQAKKTGVNNKITQAGDAIRRELEALNGQLITLGNTELSIKQRFQQEHEARRQLVNKANQASNDLANKEQHLSNELLLLQNKAKRAATTLQGELNNLSDHRAKISRIEKEIEEIAAFESDLTKINKLKGDIALLEVAEASIKERIDAKRKEKESVDSWDLSFKAFKSNLANKSIQNIQDYTNLFLEGMGSDITIKMDGYRTLASKKISEKITTSILRGGFDEGSYGAYSGGERGRIDVSNTLALQELINVSSPTGGLDFLLIDECLDQVDALGLELIINSLQSIGKTIMIISQLTDINTIKEHTITIQKVNKVSTILN